MIEIVSGTDRPGSYTKRVADYVLGVYREQKLDVDLIDLNQLNYADVAGGDYYKGARGSFATAVERVTKADGVVLVVPEYNGSYPGALKMFIDYWRYPSTFENRPFAFVGLGTHWGGLRPVEHLQQVVGFRSAYCFPHRVFLANIKEIFKEGRVTDPLCHELVEKQAREFHRFIRGLKDQGLHANVQSK